KASNEVLIVASMNQIASIVRVNNDSESSRLAERRVLDRLRQNSGGRVLAPMFARSAFLANRDRYAFELLDIVDAGEQSIETMQLQVYAIGHCAKKLVARDAADYEHRLFDVLARILDGRERAHCAHGLASLAIQERQAHLALRLCREAEAGARASGDQ